MPRHKKEIPVNDVHLKGLKTLIDEKKTQEQIAEYYRQNGIEVDQSTISRNLKKLKRNET